MKIGELAKTTGLSIRTLHYYDDIGLLSPSHRTDVGHRLYSNDDILRLQQIVSLRQIGFSLKEIVSCLERPDFSPAEAIDLHRTRLQEQIAASHLLLNRLEAIARELQSTQPVAVDTLIHTIEAIAMSRQQYFSPEQHEMIDARFRLVETEWHELLSKTRAEMANGTAFSNPSVQELARLWQWSMKSLIGGDSQIYEAFVKMYQRDGAAAASWASMDAATFEYIIKAVSFLSLTDDVNVIVSETNFTPDALHVIQVGLDAVIELNFDFFGTEGLLLGMLAAGHGIVTQVLIEAGATFTEARQEIVYLLGEHAPGAMPLERDRISFAPRVKKVVELARDEATQLGQERMNAAHLLLGILTEAETGGGVATHVLAERFGIDLAHLEHQVRLTLSQ